MSDDRSEEAKFTDEEALRFHARGRPGKLEVVPTKPMATQRDLSLAYSPGVAAPVRAIAADPDSAYDYTAKGNLVAVISNGTAILGLGNLGALASKPVMEGKSVLFKRFADVDSIDIEVSTEDVDEFVNCVRHLGPSWGGINLEDIKAPECFIIEERLREEMDIPVFHDDQHGTAIISAAGMINALDLTGRKMEDVKLVVNGAGSAGIACLELVKAMGVRPENAILCDSKGVIYQGREEGMNQWKSAHAVATDARSLADAVKGADIFFGLSVKGALTPEMLESMADQPIIFAMANPDPEITPDEARAVRSDAIVATGRSDHPNQVNNVLGFPYIFRGALDVRARTINDDMKIAAAEALAELAREDVPDEVAAAYAGARPKYGPDYIIPVPFDPRLISAIPPAVARAAMDSGVARKPIVDLEGYKNELSARLDPTADSIQAIMDKVRRDPKRIVFAEGEEDRVIRAAVAFRDAGLGTPILIGSDDVIREQVEKIGFDQSALDGIAIHNTVISDNIDRYTDFLYRRLQRQGYLQRDCARLVRNDRNTYGSIMVALGDADGMVTGLTRSWSNCFDQISRVIDEKPGERVIGVSLIIAKGRTVFVADTNIHEMPSAEELVDITVEAAAVARRFGHEPRAALLAYSTFGTPPTERTEKLRDAVGLLAEDRRVDFEFDGDLAPDIALNPELMQLYPFCKLSGPANVLIMPAVHAASISSKMLQELGGGHIIGPLLTGLSHSVQIASMGATVSDLVSIAALTSYDVTG